VPKIKYQKVKRLSAVDTAYLAGVIDGTQAESEVFADVQEAIRPLLEPAIFSVL